MKKLFCILLTLAMLLCTIPMTVTVSAEDGTVDTTAWNYSGDTFTHADDAAAKNAGRSCRIGEEGRNAKYFWNVGNALAALIQNPNYYDRTIHLIGESATFGNPLTITDKMSGQKNPIVIDGQGKYKMVVSTNGQNDYKERGFISLTGTDGTSTASLIFRDIPILKLNEGIFLRTWWANVTFENVNIMNMTPYPALTGEGGTCDIKLINSAYRDVDSVMGTDNKKANSFLNLKGGTNWIPATVTLQNSSVMVDDFAPTAANWCGSYLIGSEASSNGDAGNKLTLNVDSTSTVGFGCNGDYAKYGILNVMGGENNKRTHEVNLEKGAKVILGGSANASATADIFGTVNANGKGTVNDAGAIYTVNGSAAQTVLLPQAGETHYSVSGKEYASGATVENVAAGTTFTAASGVYLRTGASIRTADPLGIRFEGEVSQWLVDLYGNKLEYGILVCPTAKLTDGVELTHDMAAGDYVSGVCQSFFDDANGFRLALVGISATKTAVTMKFSARAYVRILDEGGNVVRTIYSDYVEADHSRSLYEVAAAYRASAGYVSNETVETILSLGGAN